MGRNSIREETGEVDIEVDEKTAEEQTDTLLVQLCSSVDIDITNTSTNSEANDVRRSPRLKQNTVALDRRIATAMQEQVHQHLDY